MEARNRGGGRPTRSTTSTTRGASRQKRGNELRGHAASHDDPATVQAATHRLHSRAVELSTREWIEIQEMLGRVVREMQESGRGWTWHLLSVLDWDSEDIRKNEKGRGRWLGLGDDAGDPREQERAWRAREKRLRSASRAFEAALPDLEWAAARWRSHAGATENALLDDIRRGRAVLLLALDDLDQVNRALAQARTIHGRVRRYEHVRAAALVMLIGLHGLDGPRQSSRLAQFIVEKNSEMRPHPCPLFAGDDPHENVRTILSRSKLCRSKL